MSNDDFVHLAQQVREAGDFEEDESLVEVIEAVLRERIDAQEPSASDEEVRAKQDELREKITSNSRESEDVESDNPDLSEAELKREELRSKIGGR